MSNKKDKKEKKKDEKVVKLRGQMLWEIFFSLLFIVQLEIGLLFSFSSDVCAKKKGRKFFLDCFFLHVSLLGLVDA